MWKVLVKVVMLLAPILIAMAGLNYWVDPRGLFHDDHPEITIADLLLHNKTAVFGADFDEYKFNRYFIPKLPNAPDLIALGSSRTMLIRRSTIDTEHFINSAVSGARLADLLVTYQLYFENDRTPSTIVIGLDTWILSRIPSDERRPELYRALARLGFRDSAAQPSTPIAETHPQHFEALLSLSYLNASMREVLRMRPTVRPFGIESSEEEHYRAVAPLMKYPDGSWEFPYALRTSDEAHTRLGAMEYSKISRNAVLGLKEADPESMRIFEGFVDAFLHDGKRVLFFLPPYHPITYSDLEDQLAENEGYFCRIAAERNIQVIGSYNPSKVGLSEANFYDANHLKPDGISKIFNQLRASTPHSH